MGTRLVVRRSGWKMWFVALAGVPFIVIAGDVLTRRRMVGALSELLFRPDQPQVLETRDVIWAWAMLGVGAALTLWGLKELVFPTALLVADATGLRLKLDGPFRRPVELSWDDVEDVGATSCEDEGVAQPMMWIRPVDPGLLPANPWGARWIDDRTLGVLAADWERPADHVASQIVEIAVEAARSEGGNT